MRVFPLSNWTELDVWHYVHREEIPIVPLYFARERPVVERDGQLILVDDERMPLDPGEEPAMTRVRFRTLGCYPLSGAVESDAETRAGDHPRDDPQPGLRAAGARDRPGQRGIDGEEEAGGLLLSESGLEHVDMEEYLHEREQKGLLRFITCGSVDDGKSTLIGRLLYESGKLFDDQLEALHADSKRIGTQGGELDFALLLDGLAAEREQGITIDVAYRYFSTEQRNFIVADTPGPRAVHAQHGHGRVDRRLRRDPGGRPQGSRHADAPAHLHRRRARDPPRRVRGHEDGSRRL